MPLTTKQYKMPITQAHIIQKRQNDKLRQKQRKIKFSEQINSFELTDYEELETEDVEKDIETIGNLIDALLTLIETMIDDKSSE